MAANNQISGQFTVVNTGNFYLPDLNYAIKLFKGTDFYKLQLVDVYDYSGIIAIAPNQTVTKSFTYQYPENIASGDYTARIQIITGQGEEIGSIDEPISLTGKNNFIDIQADSPRVVVGKNESLPLEGANVSSTDTVVAYLKVQNPGDSITVVPQIRIFDREYNMQLVKQYNDSPITFAKGETKDIDLTMPKLSTPESYLAEVKFYNNNKQVSGIQYFRWVVDGDSAKVLSVVSDKDNYSVGDNMKVTVYYIGPPDLTSIGGAKLQVTVYDQNKNVVAVKSENVNLSAAIGSAIITIPVNGDLFNPLIDAKIIKGNQALDDYKIAMPIFSKGAKQLQQKAKIENILFYPVLLLVLFIAIFLVFKFKLVERFLKNKKPKK